MSGIKGKNTKPERMIRTALHARGFRFRLHAPELAGKPDIVLPKWKAVIFVNGCFWHGHECHLHRMPSTRTEFWREKIGRNRERDARVRNALAGTGWRVLTIWECAIRGRHRIGMDQVADQTAGWLRNGSLCLEIRGAA